MYIVGAGLSGLIAAYVFPGAPIFEALDEATLLTRHHKALLRFRTDAIGRMTGIEFRKVRVNKGIYHGKDFVAPSVAMANMYSQKVIGRLADRSILNLDPVDRYVAPDDFQAQMFYALRHRINFESGAAKIFGRDRPVISTIPMNAALHAAGLSAADVRFERKPISIMRAKIANADVYQTVYYPSPRHPVYRASITGNNLIIELVDINEAETPPTVESVLKFVTDTMGIPARSVSDATVSGNAYGKIAPISESFRRAAILRLTMEHGIYSAGRFAIWKNILLDDLLDDLFSIKRMVTRGDIYDHVKESHNEGHAA